MVFNKCWIKVSCCYYYYLKCIFYLYLKGKLVNKFYKEIVLSKILGYKIVYIVVFYEERYYYYGNIFLNFWRVFVWYFGGFRYGL